MYESDDKVASQLSSIFKLLELGQVPPPRMPTASIANNANPPSSTIFMNNNIYLLNLLCTIIKRLVKVALSAEK